MESGVAPTRSSAGDGNEARPLVMLHGFLCAGRFFHPVEALLAPRRILTVDLPGFGERCVMPAVDSIGAMAAQVAAELASLGIREYDVLGHSMGGMVALQLALQSPAQVRRLIIYASNSSGKLPDRFESFAESRLRLRQDFAAHKRRICATWFIAGEYNRYFSLLEKCAEVVHIETAEKGLTAMENFDVSARLGELVMPVLIVSAAKDRTYSDVCQQQLAQRIPHAERHVMQECSHCAHLEDEQGFAAIINRWLTE